MKTKVLLILALLLTTFGNRLWAQDEETIDFTDKDYTNAQAVTSVIGTNCTVALSNAKWYDSGSALRAYYGSMITVNATNNKTIEEIRFTYGVSDGNNPITANVGNFDGATWTGNANSVTFTIGGSSNNRRLRSVEVIYVPGVTKPVINGLTSFVTSTEVTLSAEDGATIYYTIDGTDPTTSSTKYTAPFTLTATKVVKAIAVKGDKQSRVATQVFSASTPYVLVTNIDDLHDGDHVIIVGKASNSTYALGLAGTNNRDGVSVGSATSSEVTAGSDVCDLILGVTGSKYTFYDATAGGYLQASSSSANRLTTGELNDDGRATLTIESDGEAKILFGDTYYRNNLRFNYNSGTPLFSCYNEGAQKAVYIYKLKSGTIAEWSGEGTAASPLLIATPAQLSLLASRVNGGNDFNGYWFTLAQNLNFTEAFAAIGTTDKPFNGHFDGAGHTISGINNSGNLLFGNVGTEASINDVLYTGTNYAKAFLNNTLTDVYTVTSGTEGLSVSLVSGDAIVRGTTIYAKASSDIDIQLTVDEGKTLGDVSANGEALSGTGANRTLAVGTANVVITATLIDSWSGSGTAADPYIINSTAGWDLLAENVNKGETYSGQYFQLGGHIEVTKMVGSSEAKSFQGTFDGQGFTLTMSYGTSEQPVGINAAPFRFVKNVTIKRLHTAGDIYINGKFGAGLVSETYGNCTITSCRSSVNIHSTVDGDGTHGGFLGRAMGNSNTVSFTNCLFDGSLLGNSTHSCGGFSGWHYGKVRFTNCLSKPTSNTTGITSSATFARISSSNVTVTNSYYYTSEYSYSIVQGTQTDKTGEDLKNQLGAGWEVVGSGNAVYVLPIMSVTNLSGSGTSDNPYIIASADNWDTLLYNVNIVGESYAGMFFHLTGDIETSSTLGTEATPFAGTIDGGIYNSNNELTGKRTLTVNISNDDATQHGIAPFRYIAGATIKNLNVTGTVNVATKSYHAAGLVGYAWKDTNTISNCVVSATVSGGEYLGGLVGHGKGGSNGTETLIIENSAFIGTMTGGAQYAGGLLGWSDGSTLHITNSIFDGTITGLTGKFHPIAVRDNGKGMTTVCKIAIYTVDPKNMDNGHTVVNGNKVYTSLVDAVTSAGLYLQMSGSGLGDRSYYSPLTITMNDSYDYTGNDIKPTPTVTATDGTQLSVDVFTYVYKQNDEEVTSDKEIGTYTVTVTPKANAFGTGFVSVQGSKTLTYSVLSGINGNAQDGYYVQMPKKGTTGTKVVNLAENNITTIKVYDDGGKNADYCNDYNGTLTLTAPTGFVLMLTGTVTSEEDYDWLDIHDGGTTSTTKLLDHVSGIENEDEELEPRNIGTILSETNQLTFHFESDESYTYAGFEITVQVVDATTEHDITCIAADHGSISASAAKAKVGTTVTLTANPDTGYLLTGYTLSDGTKTIATVNVPWYGAADLSFKMPNSNVTVTPTFTSMSDFYVNMPTQRSLNVNIPAGVTTFKVYDDGGKDGNYGRYNDDLDDYEGNMLLTAPAGYCLTIQGTVKTEIYTDINDDPYDYLVIYDGENNSRPLTGKLYSKDNNAFSFGPVTSSGQKMLLYFKYDENDDASGLDLTVTLLPIMELANNADNAATLQEFNNKEASVRLTDRSLVANGAWNTLCLPFNVTLADSPLKGFEARTLSSSSMVDGTLTLNFSEPVETLTAGVPYIVRFSDNTNYVKYTATDGSEGFSEEEDYICLVDGDDDTKWCSPYDETDDDDHWNCEFMATNATVTPTSYTLTTAYDTEDNPSRNPVEWTLYAKANSSDPWTEIDSRDAKTPDDALPETDNATKTYEIATGKQAAYRYFKLTVMSSGTDIMQIAELKLNGTAAYNALVNPTFNNVTISNTSQAVPAAANAEVTFEGSYAPINVGSSGDNHLLYMGANNTLYYPSQAMTIGAQRAVFRLHGIEAGTPQSAVRAIVLNFEEDGETTGVAPMDNGKLKIDNEAGAWYTVEGVKLTGKPTRKGLYINNHRIVNNEK
jgi:hypothetical protein